MNTTNVFVELIIIGLGTMLWLFLLCSWVFGVNLLEINIVFQKDFPSIIISMIFLSLTYLFGILIDRFADSILSKSGNKLRAIFFNDRNEAFKAKMKSYKFDPAFASIFEYSRSRMRICRGWIFNTFFILVFGNFYIWLGSEEFKGSLNKLEITTTKLSLIFSLALFLILIACFVFWKSLQKGVYAKLKLVDNFISDSNL